MLAKTIFESERRQQILDNGLQMFFVAAGIIAVLLVVFWIFIQISRKRAQDAAGAIRLSFTLDDLRQMKEAGQLTDEEFERAKQKIIGSTRRALLGDDESSEDEKSQGIVSGDGPEPTKSDPSGESDQPIG